MLPPCQTSRYLEKCVLRQQIFEPNTSQIKPRMLPPCPTSRYLEKCVLPQQIFEPNTSQIKPRMLPPCPTSRYLEKCVLRQIREPNWPQKPNILETLSESSGRRCQAKLDQS
jgi:hypothetical protein